MKNVDSQSNQATTESTTSHKQLIFSFGKQMDSPFPEREGWGMWKESWEEEKVKIEADKKEEVNIKGRERTQRRGVN